MRARQTVVSTERILTRKSGVLVFCLACTCLQTAQAVQWERVVGARSPAVVILDEQPLWWFSPTYYSTGPQTFILTNIQYDGSRRVEYYGTAISGAYIVETHIYDANYFGSRVTGFKETRFYPISGNSYKIAIAGATYDSSGYVQDGYSVTVELDSTLVLPSRATDPSPGNNGTDAAPGMNLSWSRARGAASYDIYVGKDPNLDATAFKENCTSTTFFSGLLEYGTTYYWRVDSKNFNGTTPGDTWVFSTVTSTPDTILYVDEKAVGANDGTSWANAYNCLHDALLNASYYRNRRVDVLVAQGTYVPDQGSEIVPPDSFAAFQLTNKVFVKGGYAGRGKKDPGARDVAAYRTILSGAPGVTDSIHVVIGSGTNGTAVLDGFIITGGAANLSGSALGYGKGGGMYNSKGSPTLINCTFWANTAKDYGGGMYNSESSPILINCTFSGNSAKSGGGMYNESSSGPIMTNCILWNETPGQTFSNSLSRCIVTYSDVQGGCTGEGNINTDPLFADPNNGDLHLKSQAGRWDPSSGSWVIDDVHSPCIDAGDPASPVGLEPEPNGGRINMGAYGGTAEASKSK